MNETHDANKMAGAAPAGLKDMLRGQQEPRQSEIDHYRATGTRLLETYQARLARAEHDHQIGRARIIADAQMHLEELKVRAREDLRAFDLKRECEITELHEHVQTLLDMRDAGDD